MPFNLKRTLTFPHLRRRLRLLSRQLRMWWNRHRTTEITPYLTYGTPEQLFVMGRVLKDKGITLGTPSDSRWRNLINSYKRFMSLELAGARLRASFNGNEQELVTDDEGYFAAWLTPKTPPGGPWCQVGYQLLTPPKEAHPPVHAQGAVLIPPDSSRFGVISDIDDTVMQTDATRYLKVLYTVMTGNALTRLPFGGVAEFYQALHQGASGAEHNPLFYVSSSPWNLYDLLMQFLEIEQIPIGPLILRNWEWSLSVIREHGSHKNAAIHQILETFPKLPFILIGDSGQEDPEIYRDVVHDFPERILAVYIRNVSGKGRAESIAALAAEVEQAGSTLILTDDTGAAAEHAAKQGWISHAHLEKTLNATRTSS